MPIVTGDPIRADNFRGMIFPYAAAAAPDGFLLCDGAAVSRTTYSGLFTLIGTTYGAGDGSTTFNVPNLKGRFLLGYSAAAPTKDFTFVSRSSNTITVSNADDVADNELQTGQAVLYDTDGSTITGLTDNTTYYIIRVAYNQFQLATSRANAVAGTAITLSSNGSGNQLFRLTLTARPLGIEGGEEAHALVTNEIPAHTHSYPVDNGSGSFPTLMANRRNDGGSGASAATGGSAAHSTMPPYVVVNYIIKT